VEKYRGLNVKEVWIVVPPFQLLLFIKGIMKQYKAREKAWRQSEYVYCRLGAFISYFL